MKHMSKERRPLTRLLQARLQRHWSQRDVAAHLETSFVTVSRWERGVALPGIYYRQRLCDLFNKSAQELGLDFEEGLEEAPDALSLQETPEQEISTPDVTLPLWSVPHRRNPFFTGREPIFLRLHTTLRQRQPTVLSQSAALCGLGGIGKTQIAIEYAYRYKEEYTALFWINAETAECLFSSFITLAEFLNLSEKQEPGQQRIVAAVIRWLSNHDDWLLIFDNVEDIELLKEFLPPVQQGALLLTSRKQAFDFATSLLRLETLSMEEGLQFFLRRARWEKEELLLIPEEEAAAREIVAEMDGLPLALDQAGAYLEVTRCRPSEYLQLLQISPLPLLTERESYAEHPLSVTRTFQLAFQQVDAINPEASELLSICAFLAPDGIPEMFFLEGASTLGSTFEAMARHPLRFHAALKALLSYSLVQRNPATQTITLHRLVRAVLKAELHEEVRQTLRSRVLITMARLFPDDDVIPHYWQMCARLLPHALSILTEEEQRREEEIQLLSLMNNVAMYLSKRSRYAEAQPLFEKALQRAELAFGRQHPLVAYSLHGLARLHMDEGNYNEAKSLFEQAVTISEQALGT
ncbi:MAG TPA: helix-turn-helix transcriptional regulator, partial [Ktedonobacteraceae bacterium]|nr:helix-turn-helix transcriptional regulator [Ktedonobacteraceae bacterium]